MQSKFQYSKGMKANDINLDGTAWNGSLFWTYAVPIVSSAILIVLAISMVFK